MPVSIPWSILESRPRIDHTRIRFRPHKCLSYQRFLLFLLVGVFTSDLPRQFQGSGPIPKDCWGECRAMIWLKKLLLQSLWTSEGLKYCNRETLKKSLLFTPLRSKTCLHRAKHKQTRLPCQKVTDRFLSSSSPGCIQQSARTQLYFFVALLSPYRQKHSYHNISSSGIHKLRKTKLLIHFSGPCLKNTCSFQSRPA